MSSIQTTIQNGSMRGPHNPFGASATPAAQAAEAPDLDPTALEICNDPMPEKRICAESKYAAKFRAMKIGQALKVHPDHVHTVTNSLRKWLREKKVTAHVVSTKTYPDCPDNLGRVWMAAGLPEPKATKKPAKAVH